MYPLKFRKKIVIFFSIPVLIVFIAFISITSGCSKYDSSSNSYGNNNGNNNNTPGANDVFIQGMAFSPANKTISVGTTVKWTNYDAYAHTVISGVPGTPSGLFDSGNIGSNNTFSYTFNQAGTFNYFCKIHNSMRGTITVESSTYPKK
jgi:plastocyanin